MTEPVFETVLPYWPARVAMYWWERPDRAVRGEFEAARAGGVEHVAVDLLWKDFQSDRDRVGLTCPSRTRRSDTGTRKG